MTLRKTLIATSALAFALQISAQQKFEMLYQLLPDMTTSQQYMELSDYAAYDTQWANTYLQLAIVCENTMVHVDPLTEIETAQFWSTNALRNLGLFEEYYKSGDAKKNYDYYQNLNIPKSGKSLEDSDVQSFVDQHRKTCSDFKDNSIAAYKAIEKSKSSYNACLDIYRSLVEKYRTREEALLCYDSKMKSQLNQLITSMNECNTAFATYRQTIRAYPIQNYRQISELVPIEKYRLDGLTTSDFYANRFNLWDFETWAKEFISEAESTVLPLREKMQKAITNKTSIDYDLRLQLRKNDKSSLAEMLFDYLDLSRAIAETSTAATGASNEVQKSLLCKNAMQINEAQEMLTNIAANVNERNVMIFSEFYQNNFNGEAGLKKYTESEKTRLNSLLKASLQKVDTDVSAERDYGYSTAAGKTPSFPLWIDTETQGNYITTQVAASSGGNIVVAGEKKTGNTIFVAEVDEDGKTLWFNEMPKTSKVKFLSSNGIERVVVIRQNELPQAVVFSNKGKQVAKFNVSEGKTAFVDRSAVTKQTLVANNYESTLANVALLDSMGGKKWDVDLSIVNQVVKYARSESGYLIVGLNSNKLVVSAVDLNGTVTTSRSVMSGIASVDDCSQSFANRIGIIATDTEGQRQYVVLDGAGQTLFSTKSK